MNTIGINQELVDYVSVNVFPAYAQNDPGHGPDHVSYVIRRSLSHVASKFGPNRYACWKIFFEDREYGTFLSDIARILADKQLFRTEFLKANTLLPA